MPTSFNGAAPMKERKLRSSPRSRGRCRSFNGAAPMKERKHVRLSFIELPHNPLQWGRSDEGAETPLETAGYYGAACCFNGAAPMKERKPARQSS